MDSIKSFLGLKGKDEISLTINCMVKEGEGECTGEVSGPYDCHAFTSCHEEVKEFFAVVLNSDSKDCEEKWSSMESCLKAGKNEGSDSQTDPKEG